MSDQTEAPRSSREEQPFDLAAEIGGPLGAAETALPGAAFVTAYSFTDTRTAAIVAVVTALILAGVRLGRRESPRRTLAGLVGIGFAAYIATRTGKAEDFYLPGLLANLASVFVALGSVAIRRPLVGVIVGALDGEAQEWRNDPERLKVFNRATFLWAGVFGLRLVVQVPLYLAEAPVALGIARTAMGLPLFALAAWITYKIVRRPEPEPTP